MKRQDFNAGWMVGAGTDCWAVMREKDPERTVTLPYDCMLELPRTPDAPSGSAKGYFPEMVIALEKKFDVPAGWADQAVYLEFEGVYGNSTVTINGHYAGGNPHPYTGFRVRADQFLCFGEENRVKVVARTGKDSRWYSGAGIYREVHLLTSGLTHVVPGSYRVRTLEADAEGASVEVRMEIAGDGRLPQPLAVRTRLLAPDGREAGRITSAFTAFGGETGTLRQRFYLDAPARWSPDAPNLYRAETEIYAVPRAGLDPEAVSRPLDADGTSFGVRTLQLDPRHGLRINGKTYKLRGACIHHDNGLLGSAAVYRAEERRAEQLKAAGFNAVRSAHNPISPAFLDACDRLGIIVMDEVCDIWNIGKTDGDFSTAFPYHWAEVCARMVEKDYNHPSVVFYSIGNEIPETGDPYGARTARQLAEKLRELDGGRYIVNSLNCMLSVMPVMKDALAGKLGSEINETLQNLEGGMSGPMGLPLVTEYTKENFDLLDVCGYNYAAVRYRMDGELFPHRVLMGSETFPEQIGENWEEIVKYPHALGDFTWTGYDYLGEAGIGRIGYKEDGDSAQLAGGYPWIAGYCGDIGLTGVRRPVSYYREIVFGLRTEPYLAVQPPRDFGKTEQRTPWSFVDGINSWTWPGDEGKQAKVYVFGKGDRFVLYRNGEKAGEGTLARCRGEAEVAYAPGELTVRTFAGEAETGCYTLASAAGRPHMEAKADRTALHAGSRDLAYIAAGYYGENGVLDMTADRTVTAKVEGPGYLAGMGSADPRTEESYLSDTHKTFEGQLLAIVRPAGKGTVTVTLSDGEETKSVTLTAE